MLELPNKKYQIIYADPPWLYNSRQFQDNNRPFKNLNEVYQTMSIEDIKELPVKNICDDNCTLFLWVTNSHLKEGLEVMKSWGFKYVTVAFVWVKHYSSSSICYNYAPWTMQSTEFCLFGKKGKPKRIKKNIKQLVESVRTKHSVKPDEVRNRIVELMGNIPRIELFARQRFEGWDAWGNEVSKTTQKLLTKNSTPK